MTTTQQNSSTTSASNEVLYYIHKVNTRHTYNVKRTEPHSHSSTECWTEMEREVRSSNTRAKSQATNQYLDKCSTNIHTNTHYSVGLNAQLCEIIRKSCERTHSISYDLIKFKCYSFCLIFMYILIHLFCLCFHFHWMMKTHCIFGTYNHVILSK